MLEIQVRLSLHARVGLRHRHVRRRRHRREVGAGVVGRSRIGTVRPVVGDGHRVVDLGHTRRNRVHHSDREVDRAANGHGVPAARKIRRVHEPPVIRAAGVERERVARGEQAAVERQRARATEAGREDHAALDVERRGAGRELKRPDTAELASGERERIADDDAAVDGELAAVKRDRVGACAERAVIAGEDRDAGQDRRAAGKTRSAVAAQPQARGRRGRPFEDERTGGAAAEGAAAGEGAWLVEGVTADGVAVVGIRVFLELPGDTGAGA